MSRNNNENNNQTSHDGDGVEHEMQRKTSKMCNIHDIDNKTNESNGLPCFSFESSLDYSNPSR